MSRPLTSSFVPCASGCTRRGLHLATCGGGPACFCACHRGAGPCDTWETPGGCGPHDIDAECTGCQPRQALPGGRVCLTCWETTTDALIELPELYRDLLAPTVNLAGVRVSGTSEQRLALADGPRWSRDWVRGILRHWSTVLTLPPPAGRNLSRLDTDDPGKTAARILRHSDFLFNHKEHADQLVHDVLACHRDARRTAYPSGPTGVTLGACPRPVPRPAPDDPDATGPCGAPVRAFLGRPLVTCPGCNTVADVWWWRAVIVDPVGEGEAVADSYAIAAWISAEWCRIITPEIVRKWASAGTLKAGRLPRAVGVNPDGTESVRRDRHRRTLYEINTVRDYVTRLYGMPPAVDPYSA